MKRPHYHHIVRENAPSNWSAKDRGYITGAQDIIKKHGIDLNTDPRNFTIAENGAGAHTKQAAKNVFEALSKADKASGKAGVTEVLGNLARDMAKGIF